MKKGLVKIISISVVFCLIGVLFGIVAHNVATKEIIRFDGKTEEETNTIIINDEDIKPVEDYDAKEVLGIALGKVTQSKSFEVITTGQSVAESIITTNVKINNRRIVKDDEAFIECVSKESYDIATLGSQRFLSGDKVAMRSTTNVNDNAVATFDNDNVTIIDNEEYIIRYGWLPYQMNGYIFNNNTFLEDPIMSKNDDETYTLHVKLNPNSDAAFYYKREVATNAKATKEPVFKEIEFKIKIDSNFVIQEVKTHEKYEVTVNMFIEITSPTTTDTVDTYKYDDISFDDTLYNYYKEKLNA